MAMRLNVAIDHTYSEEDVHTIDDAWLATVARRLLSPIINVVNRLRANQQGFAARLRRMENYIDILRMRPQELQQVVNWRQYFHEAYVHSPLIYEKQV